MVCTNHWCGWPGYRWSRGPAWTTTGVIRPVTEIKRSIPVTVDHFAGEGAHQRLIDVPLADPPAWRAVRGGVAVVDLAGCKPAIRHRQHATETGGLVHQLRFHLTHGGIGGRPAKRPPAHPAFHGGHVGGFVTDCAHTSPHGAGC